jgi:hypothetical protein
MSSGRAASRKSALSDVNEGRGPPLELLGEQDVDPRPLERKLIADAETDRLLGAHAVGPHATDIIGEAAVAIRAELTAEELGRTIHCHPTFAEAWMEAAHAAHGACIHAPPKKR